MVGHFCKRSLHKHKTLPLLRGSPTQMFLIRPATKIAQRFSLCCTTKWPPELQIIAPVKEIYERKIVNIFLPINLSMCFGCSKEPSH